MFGLVKKGNSYQVQYRVPEDVRMHFGGLKKLAKTIRADNDREADRLAAEEQRLFKRRVLDLRTARLSGDNENQIAPERIHQAVGCLFALIHPTVTDRTSFDDAVMGTLLENDSDQRYPLLTALPREGAVFDDIVSKVEALSQWTDSADLGRSHRTRKQDRPEATMIGAHAIYAKRTAHTPKTVDQYLKDVKDFTRWFEVNRKGVCYGARIRVADVNDWAEAMMDAKRAQATIKRALSACALVYKTGRFGESNPFAGVHDRIIITGSRLEVRAFTDAEVLALLKLNRVDANVHVAMLIAAYSGMRLREIADLKIKNIERIGSSRVFDLMNAGRRKTKSSYRKVPVHPVIWKELAAFIKGRDPEDYILPGEVENKYDDRSANLSKRLATAIDKITTDDSAREHSFRHAFISKMAEVGIRKEWRIAIVGHASNGDTHDEYTHTDFIDLLLTQIEKVAYAAK